MRDAYSLVVGPEGTEGRRRPTRLIESLWAVTVEPLWLCRDNFIRTSVRKVAGGTDNAFRRVAWEDSKRVDPPAAFREEG